MATKVDLVQLTKEIRNLKRYHKLYRVLKIELEAIDHWKDLKRGDPYKAQRILKSKK
jgi:hypothetical protein